MLNRFASGLIVAILFATNLIGAKVQAQNQDPSEAAIHYRQSVFKVMVFNYVQMGAMVRGAKPYDAKEFQTRATRVAAMSAMIEEGFASDTSKSPSMTEAKAEIWTNMADFKLKASDLQRESSALMKLSKSGKLDKIKPQFAKTSGTCKACHDKYKTD